MAVVSLSIIIASRAQTGSLAPPVGAASAPQDTSYEIVGRDANSSTWARTEYQQGPTGNWIPHVHRYVETATGLNFFNSDTGQWEASSEEILPTFTGAVAEQGQHKVTFSGDLSSADAVDVQTPDGQVLHTRLLGLSYFDYGSGKSVMIAEITNCTGQIIASNQAWYDNAFSGVKAGVRYTYTRDRFEQDIILEERPPAPEVYGLNSSSTILQALTEFISGPAPKIRKNLATLAPGLQMQSETLDFGRMQIGRGRAFLMGNDSQSSPVNKEWLTLEGRQFLVEEIPISQIAQQLQTLPAAPSVSMRATSNSVLNVVSERRLLPGRPIAQAVSKPMKVASLPPETSGFVLDYVTFNTSQTNCIFQSDTTYFLSGNVNLYGTNTTFEGGTVLKFAANVTLTVDSPVTWKGGSYRPVAMIAKDCDTTGEPISGSTGNPGSSFYANVALNFDGTTALTNLTLDNLRIQNASVGVALNGQSGHVLSDVQLVNCGNGLAATNTDFTLHNALFYQVNTNFSGNTATGRVEQLTSDTGLWLNQSIGANLFLTNCLLTAVTNIGSCTTQAVATLPTNNGIYQVSAPGGLHYLASGSIYRNAGTTNISAATLALLRQKTTYPPIVYSNTMILTPTTFSPQAQRDTDLPDLGYHYDPMDYVFGGVISNANLTFTAGTAVGWYRTASGYRSYGAPIVGIGLNMANSAIADFQGTLAAPDYWVRCSTVQEQDLSGGFGPGGLTGSDDQFNANISISPEVHVNFTKCVTMAGDQGCIFRDDWGYLIVRARNSEFDNGDVGGYVISCYFTNCLWDRNEGGQVEGHPGDQWFMRNCTLHGGQIFMSRSQTEIPVSVRDCSFDGSTFSVADGFSSDTNFTDYDYNAYTNATDPFPVGGTHDKASTIFNWKTSWLGNYYLPPGSTLINAGDLTADQYGLYHFTTQTNQLPETNSVVDIGYHYVATDSSGNPLDSNGNGVPDYIEDTNGTGQGLTITLVAPASGSYYAEPANPSIQASVTDWRSTVTNVNLFAGASSIDTITNAPYQYSWPIVPAGTYSLTGIALDVGGSRATSAPVSITVTNLCGNP